MANIVILTGPVEKVEERHTQQNKRVLCFTIKTTEHYQGKSFDSWHKCESWDEGLSLSDGEHVALVGKLKHTSWEDKNGQKQYRTYVSASSVDKIVAGKPGADMPPLGDDDLPF